MSLPPIALRPAAAADAAFLAELYCSTRWDELASTGWSDAAKRTFLHQQLALQTSDWARHHPDASRDIVLVDRVAAGRLYVDRRPTHREVCVVDIALLPAFRGRGIGTWLLQEIVAAADRDGCETILHVEPHNPARHLYARLGFAPVRQNGLHLMMRRAAARTALAPARPSA